MTEWELLERHQDQERMRLASNIGLIIAVIALFAFICLFCTVSHAEEENAVERIVGAIYQAEGGTKAKVPFGILSVKCGSFNECQQICRNTVINNRKRFQKYRKAGGRKYKDFIEFLAHRYAPVNSDTDNGTNQFWISNVRYFLAKGE